MNHVSESCYYLFVLELSYAIPWLEGMSSTCKVTYFKTRLMEYHWTELEEK